VAVAPPGADVTKPSAGGNPTSSTDAITDAEAMAALAKSQPSKKAEPPANAEPRAKAEPPAKTENSGNAEEGPRKPPTLLEPGENVEKVKAPSSPQQQSQSK
jgi:hypothetical protein